MIQSDLHSDMQEVSTPKPDYLTSDTASVDRNIMNGPKVESLP